ncbi:MAG: EamA family transporter RarD [Phycisphaerales bacterium]|nr:EamA family transporter RarD [Phycisphaerales bacterium]
MPQPSGSVIFDHHHASSARRARVGVTYGLFAYAAWGLVPIYFKAVAHVPAMEVLAHRIIWSVVLLTLLILVRRQGHAVRTALRSPRLCLTLAATTALIAVNWFVFIWAIAHDRVLEASLGYFINPLVSILLGFLFLKERLRAWQMVGLVLATIGVIARTVSLGELPIISLTLAGTFGLYGLLRKTAPVDSLVGLTIETLLLIPAAIAYVVFLACRGESSFVAGSLSTDVLLILAGVVTAVPLLWFTGAVRRVRLTTLGFLQYVAPTGNFILAVFVYREAFRIDQLVSFLFIWIALVIYTIDAARHRPRTAHRLDPIAE